MLVRRLASNFGITHAGKDGKLVWAELPVAAEGIVAERTPRSARGRLN
jgi:hypothetical protein